jgi:hypothetical protein
MTWELVATLRDDSAADVLDAHAGSCERSRVARTIDELRAHAVRDVCCAPVLVRELPTADDVRTSGRYALVLWWESSRVSLYRRTRATHDACDHDAALCVMSDARALVTA